MERPPSPPSPEQRERVNVSKLHFLIHPGFLMDREEETVLHLSPVTKKQRAEFERVSKQYVERAKQLGPTEVMIGLAHRGRGRMKEDVKSGNETYARVLKEIKGVLGKRLLVFSDDLDAFDHPDRVMEQIMTTARARGFDISSDVETEAIGELTEACVELMGANLNRAGGFKEKTLINPKFTEWSKQWKGTKKEIGRAESRIEETHEPYVTYRAGRAPRGHSEPKT